MEIIHVGSRSGGGSIALKTTTSASGAESELSQAIRNAKPGQVIRIHAGTYIEPDGIAITGSDITLENAGDGIAMISALTGPIVITASVTVRGLHFIAREPSLPAVTIASGEPKLSRCTIQSLHVDIDARPTVEDCLISGSTSSGLIVSGAASGVYRNNIIKLHSGYGVHCVSTGQPVFEGNIIMRTGCGAICVSGSGYARLEHNMIQDTRWVHGQEIPTQTENLEEDLGAIKKLQNKGAADSSSSSSSAAASLQQREPDSARIKNAKNIGAGAVPTFVWEYAPDGDTGPIAVTTRAAVTICGGASAHFAHNTVYNCCAHGLIIASKWSVRVPFRKHNLGVLATTALSSTSRSSAASAASLIATKKTQTLAASVDMAVARKAGFLWSTSESSVSSSQNNNNNNNNSSNLSGGRSSGNDRIAANERKATQALALALDHAESGNVIVQAAATRCIVVQNEVRNCALTGMWACGQLVEVESAGNSFEQLGCEGVRVDLGAFAYLHHETIAFYADEGIMMPASMGSSTKRVLSKAEIVETVGMQCSGVGSSAILQDSHVKGAHAGVCAADGAQLTVIRTAVSDCSTGMSSHSLAQLGAEGCTLERHTGCGCEVETAALLRLVKSGIVKCLTGVAARSGGKPEIIECGLTENVVAVRATDAAAGFFRRCRFVASEQTHVEHTTLANVRYLECSFARVVSGKALVEVRMRGKGKFISNNFEMAPRAATTAGASAFPASGGAAEVMATCALPREVQSAAVLIESGGDPEFHDNLFAAAAIVPAPSSTSTSFSTTASPNKPDEFAASFTFDGSFVYPNCFVIVTKHGLGLFTNNIFVGEGPSPPTAEQVAQHSAKKNLTFDLPDAAAADEFGGVAAEESDSNSTSATTSLKQLVGDMRPVRGFQTTRGGDPIVRSNTFQQMRGEAIFVSDAGIGCFEKNLFCGYGTSFASVPSKSSLKSQLQLQQEETAAAVASVRFYGRCGPAQLRSNEFDSVFIGVVTEGGAAPCIARNVFHGSTYIAIRCRSESKPAILQNGFRRSNVAALEQPYVRRRLMGCAVLEISQPGTAPYVAFNTFIDNTSMFGGANKQQQRGGGSGAPVTFGAVYITNEASPTLHGNIISGECVGVLCDGASCPRLMANMFCMNDLAVACIGSCRALILDNMFRSNDRGLLVSGAAEVSSPATGSPTTTTTTAAAKRSGASSSPQINTKKNAVLSNPSWINSHAQPSPRVMSHGHLHPLASDDDVARKMLQEEKAPLFSFPCTCAERESGLLLEHNVKAAAAAAASSSSAEKRPQQLSFNTLAAFDNEEAAASFHVMMFGNALLYNGTGAVFRGGASVWVRGRDCFVGNAHCGLLVVGNLTGGEVVEAVFHDNSLLNVMCLGGPSASSSAQRFSFSPTAPSPASSALSPLKRGKSLTGSSMAGAAAAATAALALENKAALASSADVGVALTFSGCVFSGLCSQVSCRKKRMSTFFRNCAALGSLLASESGAGPVFHGCVIKWRSDTDACASTAISAESDARPMIVDCSLRNVADGFMLRRCRAIVAHCIVRKVRGVGVTIGEGFNGIITRCHISANGCGGIVVLGRSSTTANTTGNNNTGGNNNSKPLPALSYCRIFEHAASKSMLNGSSKLPRPDEEPFSGVELDATTQCEAMTSLAPGDDFAISIIGPAESVMAASAIGGSLFNFHEQPMISGAPQLLTKFYPSDTDGCGVGIFVGDGGSLYATENMIFGNAVANVVFKSRFASRIENSILSDSHLFGVVVDASARGLTVVNCDIKENGLAGVLALPGSGSNWLHSRIRRNPIGAAVIADNCAAFGSCLFSGNTVTGVRLAQNSRARIEDCFFNNNACAAEFWGGPQQHRPRVDRRSSSNHNSESSPIAGSGRREKVDAAASLQFAHVIFNNNDIASSTFMGVVVSGECAPKLYRNIFRSHRGVAALMARRGAKPVVSCGFFSHNAFALVSRLGSEPSVSQNVFLDNETGVLCEWRSAGLFSLNTLTQCGHSAVTCRTAADPHFLYCLFEECAPIIVSTEGIGLFESLTFRDPVKDCFVVNRAGDPVIRNTSFALLHLVHRKKIFDKVKAIINADKEVWKPPVIAKISREEELSNNSPSGTNQKAGGSSVGGNTSNSNNKDKSASSPRQQQERAVSGPYINSFARIAQAASDIMRSEDEHVLFTSTTVVDQPQCVIRVENGGKCTVERCLFLLNGCSSIISVGALSSVALDHNVFSSHMRLPAVIIANLATGTLRDNLFSHNLRGVYITRANPSIADCLFNADSVSIEASVGATVFVSNCQFVDGVLGVNALEGSYVTVKSSQFIGCEVGALFARGSQALFSGNSGSWCTGATAVLRTSADHLGTVERCTFFAGKLAVQVDDECSAAISGLDCIKTEQIGVLVGDSLNVSLSECKMRSCQIGIKLTGARSAALVEKCTLTFNRVGLEVADGANPTVLGCAASFNDTAIRFHDSALGTLSKLDAHDNRVGVAIECGIEGFPSLSQCTIVDGDIGLLLDGDAVGECKRSTVHTQSSACVLAKGRTLTELSSTVLSSPAPSSSETQFLIVNVDESRLRVSNDVTLNFNQRPLHRNKTAEQRVQEAVKSKLDHEQFLEATEERFRREERLARAMVERWITDIGACSTHAVDPDAPLNLLHRVVIVAAKNNNNNNHSDTAGEKEGDGGGVDVPAGSKKHKLSLKSAAKKLADVTTLVKKLGGSITLQASCTFVEESGSPSSSSSPALPGGIDDSAKKLSAAAQALAITAALLSGGSPDTHPAPSSAALGFSGAGGAGGLSLMGTQSLLNAAAAAQSSTTPLTGIVTVEAVAELVIVYGRRAARMAPDQPANIHDKFGETPASLDLELVRLGVATVNRIKCGTRAGEHDVPDFAVAVGAAGDTPGDDRRAQRRSTVAGESAAAAAAAAGSTAARDGSSLVGAAAIADIALVHVDDDDDDLLPSPARLRDRRRSSMQPGTRGVPSSSGVGGSGSRRGGAGGTSNTRRVTSTKNAQHSVRGGAGAGSISTNQQQHQQQQQQQQQQKRSSSRNNNSSSSIGRSKSPITGPKGKNALSSARRPSMLGVPSQIRSGRSSPTVATALTGSASRRGSAATARSSSLLGGPASPQVFHRSDSRNGVAPGGSKALSVLHNAKAAAAGSVSNDSHEQRAKDVLRKFMETMNPELDVADEALGTVVQDVTAYKMRKAEEEAGKIGVAHRLGSPTPAVDVGTPLQQQQQQKKDAASAGGASPPATGIVIHALKQQEQRISILPPITRLSSNNLILPEREFYAAQSNNNASVTPRRKLVEGGARPDQAGVLLPYLRPFPPSRLALDCFSQPQPHKFGYGAQTLAAVVKLAGAHNPLFADQVLHAFAKADRQRRELVSCADAAIFILQLCEQYRYMPQFDSGGNLLLAPSSPRTNSIDTSPMKRNSSSSGGDDGALARETSSESDHSFENGSSVLRTSTTTAAAAAASSQSGVVPTNSTAGVIDTFGPHVQEETTTATAIATAPTASTATATATNDTTDQLTIAVYKWVRDTWLDVLFMPDTACQIGLAEFAKLILLPKSPFAVLFKAHFSWMGRKTPNATG